jgi:putative cardiolipin synthase
VSRTLSLIAAVIAVFVAGCASLPSQEGRTATTALTDTADTRLGRAVAAGVAAHPGLTGVHPLRGPHDAFAARMLLAAAAEKSIDAQYYIWQGDEVGMLLFEALWDAAGRGVRVRLLLDDLSTGGIDSTVAVLDAHPNIEVRLYNPLVHRNVRLLNFLTDFGRVNRRMHNKSMTFDSQVTVVGGRNIGNEYFAAGVGVAYVDLDVVAVGAAVGEVAKEFDLYWNSASAYPAASFVGTPPAEAAAGLKARFAATRADPDSVAYLEAARTSHLARDLYERRLAFEWTTALLVYDDPAKTLDTTARTDLLLFPEMVRRTGRPERTLDLVSPFLVTGEEGTATLVALAARVKIRVLTNSLASADANYVHSGYAKRRRDLLRAGVQLYEIKTTVMREERSEKARKAVSSASGLHAKTLAVDGSRVFVGSFNFDPRSARLNTEMGLVIVSPSLAQRLAEFFDTEVPQIAYEAKLGPDGDLEWVERTSAGETTYSTEPGTTWLQRRSVDFYSILPIDWML